MDGGQPDPWQVWRDNHIRRAAPQQPPNPNLQFPGQTSSVAGQTFSTTPEGCGGVSRGVFVTRAELLQGGGLPGMDGSQSMGGAMGSSMPVPPFSNVVGMNQQGSKDYWTVGNVSTAVLCAGNASDADVPWKRSTAKHVWSAAISEQHPKSWYDAWSTKRVWSPAVHRW